MNIGLIAHDSKKKLMQNFCIAYRGILCKNELYATGTTGRLIEEVTNLNVHKYLAGHLGCITTALFLRHFTFYKEMTIFALAQSGRDASFLETLKTNFTLYFSLMISSF